MESNRAMRPEYAIARVPLVSCNRRASRSLAGVVFAWARACRPAPDTFVNLSPAGLALFDAALDWAAGAALMQRGAAACAGRCARSVGGNRH